MKYIALLRGINVGKSVKVPMKTLQSVLQEIGLSNISTYLNSGNALFESGHDPLALNELIEAKLEETFGQAIPTLVKRSSEIIDIANAIPADWQNNQTEQTYVAYLFNEVASPQLIEELPIKKQYMEIKYVHEAIIWNIKRENYNRSHITKIVAHPAYAKMTTRNANTARNLALLCSV